jgi:transposase
MRPYSNDLRERVVGSMESGRSARATAALFGVSVASAVRWSQRKRRTGAVAPGKIGGHRKLILLSEREWLLARLAVEPDATLRGLVAELDERGVRASYGSLWRLLRREGLSFKKKPVRKRAGSAVDRVATGAVEEVSGAA